MICRDMLMKEPTIKNNPLGYFSEITVDHLRLQQTMSKKHQLRSQDVTLACKLTLVYGKYHLMMLHRQLAMSEKRTSFQQAEKTADMMNMMTVFHSSPTDFLHTKEQSTDESMTFTRNTNNSWQSIATSILNQISWISSARRSMRTRNISSSSNHFATCTSLYMLMRCSGISRARLITKSSVCSSKN